MLDQKAAATMPIVTPVADPDLDRTNVVRMLVVPMRVVPMIGEMRIAAPVLVLTTAAMPGVRHLRDADPNKVADLSRAVMLDRNKEAIDDPMQVVMLDLDPMTVVVMPSVLMIAAMLGAVPINDPMQVVMQVVMQVAAPDLVRMTVALTTDARMTDVMLGVRHLKVADPIKGAAPDLDRTSVVLMTVARMLVAIRVAARKARSRDADLPKACVRRSICWTEITMARSVAMKSCSASRPWTPTTMAT